MTVNITMAGKVLTDTHLDTVLRPIYYAKGGFQGVTGLHSKLPKGSASKDRVRKWIAAQTVGRYTQTKPPRTVYAHFSETIPNRVHQADLLFMPTDKGYKYALNVVDIASRYKVSIPLKTKYAAGVAKELVLMYKKGPLRFPKKLMVDDGGEFKKEVSTLMHKHDVEIRRAEPGHHRSQAFVESFNRWLAQRLFRGQYEKELATNKDNREWVSVLQTVVADINTTPTRLTGIAPADAIKMSQVPIVGRKSPPPETPLVIGTLVYIAANDEDPQGKAPRRATDPWWTHKAYPILKHVREDRQPMLYYTAYSKHGYTRSQLRPA